MAIADSTARKQVEEPAPLYRSAPHNIEAEQALLVPSWSTTKHFTGSPTSEPEHFFEPMHQQIYDRAHLIRAGKLATGSR